MQLPLLFCLILAAVVNGQFVNHYEVLGLKEDCTSSEVRKAYLKMVITHHPDKNMGQESEIFVHMSNAYTVLRDSEQRQDFDNELEFYKRHGRWRWQFRYRMKPDVWLVALIAILISVALQYYIKRANHYRMQMAAKSTPVYIAEVRRRRQMGMNDYIEIVVNGAEHPVWTDLWPIALTLMPYKIFNYFVFVRPAEREERARKEAEYEALTPMQQRAHRAEEKKRRITSARAGSYPDEPYYGE